MSCIIQVDTQAPISQILHLSSMLSSIRLERFPLGSGGGNETSKVSKVKTFSEAVFIKLSRTKMENNATFSLLRCSKREGAGWLWRLFVCSRDTEKKDQAGASVHLVSDEELRDRNGVIGFGFCAPSLARLRGNPVLEISEIECPS